MAANSDVLRRRQPVAGLELAGLDWNPLPDWKMLSHLVYRPTADQYPERVAHLKKPMHWFFRKGGELFFKLFLRDPTFTKFLDYGWYEVIDLMADQVLRNRALHAAGLSAQQLAPYSHRRLLRGFHQQPCTRETVLRRADVCAELVDAAAPVLLLGDDDLVSVELARRGFRDVTVVDIDPSVLESVRREAAAYGLTINLQLQDFCQPAPAHLRRDYALVSFDPIYSIAGIDMFLGAARAMTEARPGTRYLMSVHLMSLMSDGVPQLEALYGKYGLTVRELCQGFNVYPMLRHVSFLVQIVNTLLMHSATLSTRRFTFPYVFSDALILEQS